VDVVAWGGDEVAAPLRRVTFEPNRRRSSEIMIFRPITDGASQRDFVAWIFLQRDLPVPASLRQLTRLGDDVLSDPTKNIYP